MLTGTMKIFFAYLISYTILLEIGMLSVFAIFYGGWYGRYEIKAIDTMLVMAIIFSIMATMLVKAVNKKTVGIFICALLFVFCPLISAVPMMLYIDLTYTHSGIAETINSVGWRLAVPHLIYLFFVLFTIFPGTILTRAIARRFHPVPPAA